MNGITCQTPPQQNRAMVRRLILRRTRTLLMLGQFSGACVCYATGKLSVRLSCPAITSSVMYALHVPSSVYCLVYIAER